MFSHLALSTRLGVSLVVLMTGVMFLFGWYELETLVEHEREELSLRADVHLDSLQTVLGSALWDLDKDIAAAALEGLARDRSFALALVLDERGEEFAVLARPGMPTLAEAAHSLHYDIFSRPVFYQRPGSDIAEEVGHVSVAFSLEIVEEHTAELATRFITIVGALIVVFSFVSVMVIRGMTAPIAALTRVMDRRADGDYSTEVAPAYLRRRDEIGAIARSLVADQRRRRDEHTFHEVAAAMARQLQLNILLDRIMQAVTEILDVERSSLYLHDPKLGVLVAHVAQGVHDRQIVVEPGKGLTGRTYETGKTVIVNEGDAAADEALLPKVGSFVLRSSLSVPIVDKQGVVVGVIQALNKSNGAFTADDESRLNALASQSAIAIENARLFDSVLSMRNYNESILQSLSNGVLSFDEDGCIATLNAAARRILEIDESHIGAMLNEVVDRDGLWLSDMIGNAVWSGLGDQALDNTVTLSSGKTLTVNASATPLMDLENSPIGGLLVLEDISSEKRVRATMSRYMSKAVVDRMMEEGSDTLGGTAQIVTVLFSDIRNFTGMSEVMGPRETVALLNEYFGEMVEVVDRSGGILDKYIGDAIMAVFGAPFASELDAANAVDASERMIAKLAGLNRRRAERGLQAIKSGIGLNTGECIAGNIGSERRMDYTVIGDAVNLASRLEGTTKLYGVDFLITAFTYEALDPGRQARFREIDLIRVKGREHPISIYEGVGPMLDAGDAATIDCLELEAKAIAAYRDRNWTQARALFSAALDTKPQRILSRVYLERVEMYAEHDPGESWDRVWTMIQK